MPPTKPVARTIPLEGEDAVQLYAMEIMHNIGHLRAQVVLLQAKIAESQRFLDGVELDSAGTAKSAHRLS